MEVVRTCPKSNTNLLFSADEGRIEICTSLVSALLRNLFYAILTFLFAVVGTILGAMTGAPCGIKSKKGFLQGAWVGGIAGAYFFIEAVKASVDFWNSYDNEPVSFLQFIEVVTSLLNTTLLYLGEKFGSGRPNRVRNQVGTVEAINEGSRFIDSKGANISVHRLPKIRITGKNMYDASGNQISCSVCLEDFRLGEVVGRLPLCHHMFHGTCIAKWRTRRSSCPLCRRNQ